MLKQSLFEVVLATVLSNHTFADFLRRELISSCKDRNELLNEDFRKRCINKLSIALDDAYPRQYRLDDIELAFNQIWLSSMFKTGDIPFISYLFDEMLEVKDKSIHYRDSEVERYIRFSAKLDPSILVGWSLVKKINRESNSSARELKAIVDAQEPVFSSTPNHQLSYTDGHVHLNGVYFSGVSLIHQLTEEGILDDFDSLTKLGNALLSSSEESLQINNGVENIARDLKIIWNSTIGSNQASTKFKKNYFSYITTINIEEDIVTSQWLKKQIAIAIGDDDYTKAWLWQGDRMSV